MILAFEMTWAGSVHASTNSSTLQILARAWPSQDVLVHAEASHIENLRQDEKLSTIANLHFVPIVNSKLYFGKTHLVSFRRMAREFRTVLSALRKVPRNEPCFVFLISTTATAPFAAAWAAWLSGRRCVIHAGLHGNLNDAFGWRSRNPLRRALDTRSALTARYPVPTRFLVLEKCIQRTLGELLPGAAARTDVLPLPVNMAEASLAAETGISRPIRFGFLGLGTKAKGMDLFLSVAARVKVRWGDQVEFVHVGKLQADAACPELGLLAHPPSFSPLPRDEFVARLSSLHYVILPFQETYYRLSASGALTDAVTWLKPVIALRLPLTEQYFADHGDIGDLCDDTAGLEAAVDRILARPDGERRRRQMAALRHARDTRSVEAIAAQYRARVEEVFPVLAQGAAG